MGRTKQEYGRWSGRGVRLDLIQKARVIAAQRQEHLYEVINAALEIGLRQINAERGENSDGLDHGTETPS